jgi:hypothetical protein
VRRALPAIMTACLLQTPELILSSCSARFSRSEVAIVACNTKWDVTWMCQRSDFALFLNPISNAVICLTDCCTV